MTGDSSGRDTKVEKENISIRVRYRGRDSNTRRNRGKRRTWRLEGPSLFSELSSTPWVLYSPLLQTNWT